MPQYLNDAIHKPTSQVPISTPCPSIFPSGKASNVNQGRLTKFALKKSFRAALDTKFNQYFEKIQTHI
jgi:hypothetical protein